jgi:hypothetical protein
MHDEEANARALVMLELIGAAHAVKIWTDLRSA